MIASDLDDQRLIVEADCTVPPEIRDTNDGG
jgi:hypothetical protein